MKGHFKRILCVLNDTHEQDELIDQAVHVAKSHQASLTLMLALEALPPNANIVMESFSYIDSQQSMEAAAQAWMDKLKSDVSAQYPVDVEVCIGQPLMDIVQTVVRRDIDLVVKLSDDGFLDRVFGGEDMRLLRKCPCAVWITHRKAGTRYKNVVAALDLNYHDPEHEKGIKKLINMDVLRSAAQVALLEFSQLHIVHVFDAVPDNLIRNGLIAVDKDDMDNDLAKIRAEREQILEDLLTSLNDELDGKVMDYLQPQRHLVHGNPRKEIVATAKSLDADVVVIGTVERLDLPGFTMGGTAEETIHQLNCEVLGIKPAGFVSPLAPDHPVKD